MPITTTFISPLVRIGTCDSLLVSTYLKTPTVAVLDEQERVQLALLEKHQMVSTLAIAGPNSSLLRIDESVRKRSVEMTKKFQGRVRGAAIVIATKGLSAVMARSFMSGYLLITKTSWPIQTFSAIDAATHWLRALPGQDARLDITELETFDLGG